MFVNASRKQGGEGCRTDLFSERRRGHGAEERAPGARSTWPGRSGRAAERPAAMASCSPPAARQEPAGPVGCGDSGGRASPSPPPKGAKVCDGFLGWRGGSFVTFLRVAEIETCHIFL